MALVRVSSHHKVEADPEVFDGIFIYKDGIRNSDVWIEIWRFTGKIYEQAFIGTKPNRPLIEVLKPLGPYVS